MALKNRNGIPKKTKIRTKIKTKPIASSKMGFFSRLFISKEIKG